MFEPPHDPDADPGSGSADRWIIAGFSLFLLFAFAMEIADGNEPAKLSILWMLAFWMPLLVLHEAGHALAARALGWRVERVVIGFGAPWRELRIAGTRVELRRLPVEGFVETFPDDGVARPLPHAAIYFAGPGVELLLALALLAAFGPERFLAVGAEPGLLVWQSLALAAAMGGVLNLIPHSALDGEREIPNDGLGILLALRGPQRFER
jgi:membrane-associated protease RseP (regulator of RpoE activity)